ncbi:MAG: putative bifunctional diguanylate cyclase/phosphodiesterase, partial [Blastomonas fulva]|uniref:putative bifunctional diguanylate cyclase/phosphodiesterase n=1 Tax=Blastomonas fulva TaxID=1550728 RepID=UPI0040341A32
LSDKLTKRESFSNLVVKVQGEDKTFWWELSASPRYDDNGAFIGFRGVGSDVTESRESAEKIARLARYDTLTGLPNRLQLTEALDRALNECEQWKTRCGFLMIDLDRFKSVNDTLGHLVGDRLLAQVSLRLRSLMGKDEMCGRLGGDEFAVVMRDTGDGQRIGDLAHRIIDVLSRPYEVDEHTLFIGASIGSAHGVRDGRTVETLMRSADLALYRAKKEGRNCSCFFEQAMDLEARKRHQMEIDMREAVREGQFLLNYQPLFSLEKNRVIGFEALVRWQHPLRGLVSPAEFIPLAEDTGMIVPISEWVLNEACQRAGQWPDDIRIAVNLSPVLFKNAGLPLLVMQALDKAGLKPNRLELEVTESLFIDNIERTTAMLNALRDCGVRIALDDFGTGYSSLNYLRSFPFDKIKIDKSFVDDLATDISSQAIIGAITALASALGMETIAEGVEDKDQLEALRAQGCSNIQGYLFSRPVGIELVDAMIANMRYTQAEPNDAAEPARARRVA